VEIHRPLEEEALRVESKESVRDEEVKQGGGIEISEEAIESYIESVFDQIRKQRELFLKAFLSPI